MVQTIPRRSKLHPLIQITVAVLSGAGAMYVIQNVEAAKRALVAPPPPPVEKKPEPALSAPDPVIARIEIARQPAASSMMVKPEDGGGLKPTAILGSYEDETVHPKKKAVSAAAAVERKKEEDAAVVTLRERHDFKTGQLGTGFQANKFKGMGFRKPRAEDAAPAAEADAPPPPAKSRPIEFEKAPLEDPRPKYQAPPLASRKSEEFWSYERRMRTGAAAILSLLGFVFLFVRSGFYAAATKRGEEMP